MRAISGALQGFAAIGLAAAAGHGCSADADDCFDSSSYCQGNTRVECESGLSSDTHWKPEPCPAGTRCIEFSAGAACVFPDRPCGSENPSICLEGQLHGCVDGLISAYGWCPDGTTCFGVVDPNGTARGVCALEPLPCAEPGDGDECRGNTRVTCSDGYPVSAGDCGSEELCVVDRSGTAWCAFGTQCTPELSAEHARVCWEGLLGLCDGEGAPTILRDCSVTSSSCVEGIAGGCAESYLGPAPLEWTLVPARVAEGTGTEIEAFELLRSEVTAGWYASCVEAGACPPCADCEERFHLDLPLEVPASDAVAFCTWLGGRLPTDIEWDYARRNGAGGTEWPWQLSCEIAVVADEETGPGCGRGEPWPACSRELDVTRHGICDLSGNVTEWVLAPEGSTEPVVKRGFSFRSSVVDSNEVVTGQTPVTELAGPGGFRCARTLGGPGS